MKLPFAFQELQNCLAIGICDPTIEICKECKRINLLKWKLRTLVVLVHVGQSLQAFPVHFDKKLNKSRVVELEFKQLTCDLSVNGFPSKHVFSAAKLLVVYRGSSV